MWLATEYSASAWVPHTIFSVAWVSALDSKEPLLILRSRLLAVADAGALNLHVLDQRLHIRVRQPQSRHPNLPVLLEQRCSDRIFLLDQLIRLGNDPREPRLISHVRYAKQIWSNLVAVSDRVAGSTAGSEQVLTLVDI